MQGLNRASLARPPRNLLQGSIMKAFLSHSSADKKSYVGIVASRLAEEDIVYDEMSFESGEETMNEIIRGLDEIVV